MGRNIAYWHLFTGHICNSCFLELFNFFKSPANSGAFLLWANIIPPSCHQCFFAKVFYVSKYAYVVAPEKDARCDVMIKKKRSILVKVSTLAIVSAWANPVVAYTLNLSCKQNIYFGSIAASGCTGTFKIAPNGAHVDNGCLVIGKTASAGSCNATVKTVGKAPSKLTNSVVASFAKPSFTLTAKGVTGTLTMKNLRLQVRGRTTSGTKVTLSASEVKNTATLDVGGTLYYSNTVPRGNYVGNVIITIN
jgi:hypothetical protein